MRIKKRITITLSCLLVVILITMGVFVFGKLSHNKLVFESDIYTHIPPEVTGLLQINNEKDLKTFISYFPELDPVLPAVQASISYPILIAEHHHCLYLIAKVTGEQESQLKAILHNKLFPSFAPKTKSYKSAELYFYSADNKRFFSSLFYQGFFVGGYNYTLLERFVDTDSSDNLFSNKKNDAVARELKTSYPANLYLNNQSVFAAFNVDVEENQFTLQGLSTSLYPSKQGNDTLDEKDSITIDYEIYPNSLVSYTINTDVGNVSNSLACLFQSPSYSFVLSENEPSPIYALKHRQTRFDVFNYLNQLEVNYINRRFRTNDVVLKRQFVYTTSEQMAKEVFRHDSPVYLTFYKNYLLISTNRETLIRYLKENGQYPIKEPFDPIKIAAQTSSMSYANIIDRLSTENGAGNYLMQKLAKGDVYINQYIENGKMRVTMSLNN